ncbi:aminotransferase class V-fold PLP-dependent enzyme [bacterium]|nr:aminotransferase class V-fold PLP-dependent enzyme [bacterium]
MTNRSGQLYLNNGASSFPKPERVLREVDRYLRGIPAQPGRGSGGCPTDDPVGECRARLAKLFLAGSPENIVFTSGATESLNLAIRGLHLDGAHVITTAIEHNSVLRPLYLLEQDSRISLTIVGCDQSGWVDPESILESIQPDTRLVAISHCSNVTGQVQDIEAIGTIAREHGILMLVDAAQSAGAVDINLTTLPIDLLAFTGHKAMWGLPGIGGLYIRPGLYLEPLKTGGSGIKSALLHQPPERPLLYEAGTLNMPGIVSLKAGLDEIEAIGKTAFQRRAAVQRRRLEDGLREIEGVTVYGASGPNDTQPLVSFRQSGLTPEETSYILQESYGIICRSGLHCAPLIHEYLGSAPDGTVRISPSWFTTDEELVGCLDAIRETALAGVAQ